MGRHVNVSLYCINNVVYDIDVFVYCIDDSVYDFLKRGYDFIDVIYDTDAVVYCIDDFIYDFLKRGHDFIDVVYDTDAVVYYIDDFVYDFLMFGMFECSGSGDLRVSENRQGGKAPRSLVYCSCPFATWSTYSFPVFSCPIFST
jgi:hypothetical protein